MCGSGTTLVAAKQAGRKWIGIDMDQEALNKTLERLSTPCTNWVSDAVTQVTQEYNFPYEAKKQLKDTQNGEKCVTTPNASLTRSIGEP